MEQPQLYYMEDLTNEDGTKWRHLLDYALSCAECVEFTVPVDERRWPTRLEPLFPFLLERFTSHWRWQGRQHRKSTFLRFRITPEVVGLLRSVPTLQDTLFLTPAFPEDPAFYRHGRAILWTITHEVWAFLLLTEQEARAWREKGFVLDCDCAIDVAPPTKNSKE